jgi:DNA-binding response OmpR family regulator
MQTKAKILLIEDEAGLVMTITDRLQTEGYLCEAITDGLSGFTKAKNNVYDCILLDIMLPEKNGFDVCRDLRACGCQTPILMLTARSQVIDKVLGLKLGADDYLCKPFNMEELLARIEALLRRRDRIIQSDEQKKEDFLQKQQGELVYEDFTVDFSTGYIEQNGEKIQLTAQEYKLLSYLTDHPDEIISRNTLLDVVWGYGTETSTRTVDVHIAWLRKKIGDTGILPRHIHTIRGLGYRFKP